MEDVIHHRPNGALEIQRVHLSKDSVPFVIPTKKAYRISKLKCQQKERNQTIPSMLSLQNFCILFIAKNAELLDSLEDFPDLLGSEVWHNCVKEGKLDYSNTETQTIITVFVQAYREEMLESFKSSSLLLINNFENELLIMFRYCQKLDLSGAKLGQNHDLIIALPKICQRLTQLTLKDNNLSSISLRLLFGLPYNTHTSFPFLEYIDISGNPLITCKAIYRYALEKRMKSLSTVIFSSIQLPNFPGWTLGDVERPSTCTLGWAETLIAKWCKRIEKKSKESSAKFTNTLSFYGLKKNSKPGSKEPVKIIRDVCLVRSVNDCEHQEEPPKKRPKLSDNLDIEEEDNILSLYS